MVRPELRQVTIMSVQRTTAAGGMESSFGFRDIGEGDKQSFMGGGLHIWKLLAEQTEGAFFLFEDVMVKGKTTPLHCHPEADELTYVIEGEIIVNHDGKLYERDLGPNTPTVASGIKVYDPDAQWKPTKP